MLEVSGNFDFPTGGDGAKEMRRVGSYSVNGKLREKGGLQSGAGGYPVFTEHGGYDQRRTRERARDKSSIMKRWGTVQQNFLKITRHQGGKDPGIGAC